MFATSLIVFRETLEAALFVGIVAAATRGLPQRSVWLAGGVAAGALGALAMALGMGRISAWADGIGQDVLNAGILCVALAMLAWHCVWVSTHGREMAQDARRLGTSVTQGAASLWALSVAVALSVLREGAETVLFVAGIVAGSNEGAVALLWGAGLGLLGGALLGAILYWGLGHIQAHQLFAVTNVLVLLLAGSLASQLAKTLIQAGWVARWDEPMWDGSSILSNDSVLGTLLHAMVGYDASPSGLQLAFYVGAIAAIGLATRQVKTRRA